MRRPLALLLVVVVAASLVAPGLAAAVPDARLAVSDLTTAPDTPAVDEPVTVTATVRNSAGSNSAVELTEVRLVNRDSGATIAAAAGPGSLSPGDTLAVDLTHAFNTAGTKELAVVAVGEDADDETVTVRRPLTVVVEQADPLVEFERVRPVVGSETRVGVTVANPNTEAYRDVVVRLDAPGAEVDRRTVAALAGGASTTVNFTYTPPETGAARVAATVSYVTNTGAERTTEYGEGVRVAPLREDVGVAVEPVEEQAVDAANAGGLGGLLGGAGPTGGTLAQQGGGGESGPPEALAVEVTNFGNAPVEGAVVVPTADGERLPRVRVGDLAPGESRTVEVSLAPLAGPATVTATVEYATGGRAGTATGGYDFAPPTGELTVTGVDLTLENGRLTVTGNAGNVGDGEVTGVVVSVGSAAGVTPAYPNRDYFVGTVAGSEFAPFELTAEVDTENATAVPVEVTYRVAGEQRTETVQLPLEGVEPESEGSSLGGDGAALAGGLVVGVALLAGASVLVARRFR
jgi:hypothetical protein